MLAWQLFAFIGLSVCLHRQVTHRAFRCTRTLELVHLTFACIAGQAGPITWASLHRAHHKHADTDSDIHSPNAGFWSAHAGWLLRTGERTRRDALKTPPADLCGNAVLLAFERAHFPAQILVFVLLYVAGGWAALCWLGCVRVVLTLHTAWSINSVSHIYGYRNHATPDNSGPDVNAMTRPGDSIMSSLTFADGTFSEPPVRLSRS